MPEPQPEPTPEPTVMTEEQVGVLVHRLGCAVQRLREDCAALHMAVGCLATSAGVLDDPLVQKVLDIARAAAEGDPRPVADVVGACYAMGTMAVGQRLIAMRPGSLH